MGVNTLLDGAMSLLRQHCALTGDYVDLTIWPADSKCSITVSFEPEANNEGRKPSEVPGAV